MKLDIGPIGIWSPSAPWRDDPGAAAELEDLGFSALWMGSSPTGDLRLQETLLDAGRRLLVGTSIVRVWTEPADVVAASYHRITARHPGRFVLGLGVSHGPAIGDEYRHPMRKLASYLDELDAATPPVPVEGRAIAALGPRSLEIARTRSLGSLPYLTTPEHTRAARAALGPDAFLAPEQKVVLESDPERARAIARDILQIYMVLPNYVNTWRRIGFGDADIEHGGSDRLVDALIVWGDAEAVRSGVRAHLDAGADHVAVQVVTGDRGRLPRAEFRRLAELLTPTPTSG